MTLRIPVDKIRDVIGPGGKMIRSIIERTGVKIDVEDDGRVNVASADEASAQKAIGIIQELTATPELNKTYMGKVQRITDFGAFVEIMPGLDGLLHVSEIAHYRVPWPRAARPQQLRTLISALTHAAAEAVDAPVDSIRVVIREVPTTHWGAGDVTIAERRGAPDPRNHPDPDRRR